jgi:hypothetical protein
VGGIGQQGAVILTFDKKEHNKPAMNLIQRHIYSRGIFIYLFSRFLRFCLYSLQKCFNYEEKLNFWKQFNLGVKNT